MSLVHVALGAVKESEGLGFWMQRTAVSAPFSQRCDMDNGEKAWLCLQLGVMLALLPL